MKRILGFAAILASITASATAQNNVHTGAKVIVPDGTMLTDSAASISSGGDRWYATVVEGGHSYAVEAVNSNDGLPNNSTNIQLYEGDGTTDFLTASTGACNLNNQAAPSLEGSNGGSDGKRCLFYTDLDDATPSRVLKIRVFDSGGGTACTGCQTRIRIRETTVFSRWSTNGYNMYVAVHNPSIVPLRGFVIYYPDAPTGSNGYVVFDGFGLPTLGSTQFVRNSGSTTPNHGSIHILVYAHAPSSSAAVDATIQTYAFSPSAGTFNLFVPERLNHGGPNSIGAGN